FYNYDTHPAKNNNTVPGVWKFVEDGNRDIWICVRGKYFKLNNETNEFENCNSRLGITGMVGGWSFTTDQQGNLWLGTTSGLKCYNLKDNTIYDKTHNPKGLQIFNINEFIYDILFDKENHAWISTKGTRHLYRFDPETNTVKQYFLEMQ